MFRDVSQSEKLYNCGMKIHHGATLLLLLSIAFSEDALSMESRALSTILSTICNAVIRTSNKDETMKLVAYGKTSYNLQKLDKKTLLVKTTFLNRIEPSDSSMPQIEEEYPRNINPDAIFGHHTFPRFFEKFDLSPYIIAHLLCDLEAKFNRENPYWILCRFFPSLILTKLPSSDYFNPYIQILQEVVSVNGHKSFSTPLLDFLFTQISTQPRPEASFSQHFTKNIYRDMILFYQKHRIINISERIEQCIQSLQTNQTISYSQLHCVLEVCEGYNDLHSLLQKIRHEMEFKYEEDDFSAIQQMDSMDISQYCYKVKLQRHNFLIPINQLVNNPTFLRSSLFFPIKESYPFERSLEKENIDAKDMTTTLLWNRPQIVNILTLFIQKMEVYNKVSGDYLKKQDIKWANRDANSREKARKSAEIPKEVGSWKVYEVFSISVEVVNLSLLVLSRLTEPLVPLHTTVFENLLNPIDLLKSMTLISLQPGEYAQTYMRFETGQHQAFYHRYFIILDNIYLFITNISQIKDLDTESNFITHLKKIKKLIEKARKLDLQNRQQFQYFFNPLYWTNNELNLHFFAQLSLEFAKFIHAVLQFDFEHGLQHVIAESAKERAMSRDPYETNKQKIKKHVIQLQNTVQKLEESEKISAMVNNKIMKVALNTEKIIGRMITPISPSVVEKNNILYSRPKRSHLLSNSSSKIQDKQATEQNTIMNNSGGHFEKEHLRYQDINHVQKNSSNIIVLSDSNNSLQEEVEGSPLWLEGENDTTGMADQFSHEKLIDEKPITHSADLIMNPLFRGKSVYRSNAHTDRQNHISENALPPMSKPIQNQEMNNVNDNSPNQNMSSPVNRSVQIDSSLNETVSEDLVQSAMEQDTHNLLQLFYLISVTEDDIKLEKRNPWSAMKVRGALKKIDNTGLIENTSTTFAKLQKFLEKKVSIPLEESIEKSPALIRNSSEEYQTVSKSSLESAASIDPVDSNNIQNFCTNIQTAYDKDRIKSSIATLLHNNDLIDGELANVPQYNNMQYAILLEICKRDNQDNYQQSPSQSYPFYSSTDSIELANNIAKELNTKVENEQTPSLIQNVHELLTEAARIVNPMTMSNVFQQNSKSWQFILEIKYLKSLVDLRMLNRRTPLGLSEAFRIMEKEYHFTHVTNPTGNLLVTSDDSNSSLKYVALSKENSFPLIMLWHSLVPYLYSRDRNYIFELCDYYYFNVQMTPSKSSSASDVRSYYDGEDVENYFWAFLQTTVKRKIDDKRKEGVNECIGKLNKATGKSTEQEIRLLVDNQLSKANLKKDPVSSLADKHWHLAFLEGQPPSQLVDSQLKKVANFSSRLAPLVRHENRNIDFPGHSQKIMEESSQDLSAWELHINNQRPSSVVREEDSPLYVRLADHMDHNKASNIFGQHEMGPNGEDSEDKISSKKLPPLILPESDSSSSAVDRASLPLKRDSSGNVFYLFEPTASSFRKDERLSKGNNQQDFSRRLNPPLHPGFLRNPKFNAGSPLKSRTNTAACKAEDERNRYRNLIHSRVPSLTIRMMYLSGLLKEEEGNTNVNAGAPSNEAVYRKAHEPNSVKSLFQMLGSRNSPNLFASLIIMLESFHTHHKYISSMPTIYALNIGRDFPERVVRLLQRWSSFLSPFANNYMVTVNQIKP